MLTMLQNRPSLLFVGRKTLNSLTGIGFKFKQLSIDIQTSTDMPHYVYVALCSDSTLYTGYTVDVFRRIATHNSGKGAKYTRSRLPVKLLGCWEFETKSAALKEERRIKRLTRTEKLKLLEQTPNRH